MSYPPKDAHKNFLGGKVVSTVYASEWKRIEDFLKAEFQDDTKFVQGDSALMRKLTFALKTFPEELRTCCESTLSIIKEEMQESQNEMTEKVSTVLHSNEPFEIRHLLKQMENKEEMRGTAYKIQSAVIKHII